MWYRNLKVLNKQSEYKSIPGFLQNSLCSFGAACPNPVQQPIPQSTQVSFKRNVVVCSYSTGLFFSFCAQCHWFTFPFCTRKSLVHSVKSHVSKTRMAGTAWRANKYTGSGRAGGPVRRGWGVEGALGVGQCAWRRAVVPWFGLLGN